LGGSTEKEEGDEVSDIDWEAVHAEREAEKRSNARDHIAKLSDVLLRSFDSLIDAEDAKKAADKEHRDAKQSYTDTLAGLAGVKIGSRVTRTRTIGRIRSKREQTQTFEVGGIFLSGYTELSLRGKTVLKNGSIGEWHDIGTEWELVKD
jgi:hypothetical protein